jgi:peptidoglycan/xylan/chitin deacetylase (PgdA/CDA1 family)
MPVALLYHDVVPRGQDDASGFPGPGAARYKLTPDEFREHVESLAANVSAPPLLTFDDGGISGFTRIADLLEEHGWRGHFFITTDFIDTPTFFSRQQIRELNARGHVIGSHSCSHPERMSSCTWEQILREWRGSKVALEDIVGAPVTTASVPGGFHSRKVAQAAAEAGIQILFNSEPTTRIYTIDGCRIVGRYTIYRGTSARSATALAQGSVWLRWRQAFSWKLKKAAKMIGGGAYQRVRERLLACTYRAFVNGNPPNARSAR